MAHFAKLGKGNVVLSVHVVNNEVITDDNGQEQEQLGANFLNNLYKTRDIWKQTSYNKNFRKNYAGIGFIYDQTKDAFIPPKPYPSWILNEDICRWEPPTPYPEDDNNYKWNEATQQWDLNE
jgi:hypothetical protein|tara:strand:- start:110 stop:475 length:366 start_codon:yes stop_codon:yes gene_type:complete